MKNISLYYSDVAVGGTSDKEYHIQIVKKNGSGYLVNFQYGRRGGTLADGTKTKTPVPLAEAESIFERLAQEKASKGYLPQQNGEPFKPPVLAENVAPQSAYPVELLEEIDEQSAELYIKNPKYWMQVKLDGHRRQIEKLPDGTVVSYNKKGKVTSLPAEVVDGVKRIRLNSFLIDGELIGSSFVAFDLLSADGEDQRDRPYTTRFNKLVAALDCKGANFVTTVATWRTTAEKQSGMAALYANRCEGAVFKLTTAGYRAGRNGQHKKLKFVKSVTCKVVRVGDKGHDSATLALFDRESRKWREVGRASRIGKGKIEVGDIVEILFLYATKGGRLYQPRIKEVRTDQDQDDCVIEQLNGKFKEGVEAA